MSNKPAMNLPCSSSPPLPCQRRAHSGHLATWLLVLLGLWLTGWSGDAAAQAAGKKESKKDAKKGAGPEVKKGEVSLIKRAKDGKDGKDGAATPDAKDGAAATKETKPGAAGPKKEKAGPGGPEQRRNREKSSVEDIDDELSILRELLDIERGSETEADTLLEISYVLWDRALAYDLQAYEPRLDACINGSSDKDEKRACEAQQQSLLEQGRNAKLDVINHLKRIERAFPKFAKLDEVLYSLGYHLGELDRPGEAVDAYMRLVRKTPKSNFVPDAYLGIGNYYFGKNNGGEALKWYNRVVQEYPDSAVFGWGLYYVAWVHYNTQNWRAAVQGFLRVLDYSLHDAKGRVAFVEDAGRYLVRSWAEYGNPKEALAFFKKAAEGSEVLLLDMLAQYFAEVSQFAKSNDVLDQLLEFAKDDGETLRYIALRLDNSFKLHDLGETVKSAQMLADAVKKGFKLGNKRRAALEMLLAEIATTYHGEYENTLVTATLEGAEKVYRLHGELFGTDSPNAYDMRYNHALALYQLQRWQESAAMYEQVIEANPQGKFAALAAHRALVCYINMRDPSAVGAEKAQDLADTRAVPLTKDEERVIRACERYVDASIRTKNEDEDVPKAMYIAGEMYYAKNYFDKAAALLSQFVDKYPTHEYAYNGATLLVSALWLGQDGKGLRNWVDRLSADTRFNRERLGVTLTEFKANEEYNKCTELKDKPSEAAECLVAYAQAFKDKNPDRAAQALSGAARFYGTAKKRDKMIETYKMLATLFATDKRAPQALYEIGAIYRDSADFRQAAEAFESYVRTFPTHEKVAAALASAQRYRELLGDYDKVVEDGEVLLTQFPKDKRAAEVAYNLTVQYINKNDWKGVIRASDKFLKRAEGIPVELQLAAMANTGYAQYKLAQGDRGLSWFRKVNDLAEQLESQGKLRELSAVGVEAVAQANFMRGELEFDKVRGLKNTSKSADAAQKLIAEKAPKLTEAENLYATAESAKTAKWTAAAASRRGRIWQDLATSIRDLPPPPAMARSEEYRSEWLSQVAEKAAPLFDKARDRYREALRKAAEVFAFDSYWADARDNLKTLDPKFSELSDIKEFMVEATPYKHSDPQKPADVVKELRYQLFELSQGAATDESGLQKAETTVASNPAMAKAFTRLAAAHLALNQPRDALFVSSYGMRNAAELSKSAQLWTIMAYAYQSLSMTRESLMAFEEAAKADPKAIEPLLNAAAVTLRSLDFENSVRLLDEVLRREPGHYWATLTRAVALRRVSDDPAKAKAALDSLATLAQQESRPEVHYNRCVMAQSVLTGTKAATQEALGICQKSLDTVGSKAAVAKELKKRVDGLKATLEFMPEEGAAPPAEGAPKADAAGQSGEGGQPASPDQPDGGGKATQP